MNSDTTQALPYFGASLLAPPLSQSSIQVVTPSIKRLTIQAALDKLLSQSHFSICDLDRIMELIGSRKNEAYAVLHTLHCVHYDKMDARLRQQIPSLINEVLTNQDDVIEAVDVALKGVAA